MNTKGEQATFKQVLEAARKRGQTVLAKDIEARMFAAQGEYSHWVHFLINSDRVDC